METPTASQLLKNLYSEREVFLKYQSEIPPYLQQQITEAESKFKEELLEKFRTLAPTNLECEMAKTIEVVYTYENGDLKDVEIRDSQKCNSEDLYSDDDNVVGTQALMDGTDIDENASNSNDNWSRKAESIPFSVKFPNGKVIRQSTAIGTMIETLRYIGLERVSNYLHIKPSGYPLVSKKQRLPLPDKGGDWQKYVDGWWIYINMGNAKKKEILNDLSVTLGVPFELIDDKVSSEQLLPFTEIDGVRQPLYNRSKSRALFSLNGSEPMAKNRSVLESVRRFTSQFPDATFEDIAEMFPKHLQGSYGVVRTIDDINMRSARNKSEGDRWFLEPSEILTAADGKRFAVSTEWGHQFPHFQKHLADAFGWVLEEV